MLYVFLALSVSELIQVEETLRWASEVDILTLAMDGKGKLVV